MHAPSNNFLACMDPHDGQSMQHRYLAPRVLLGSLCLLCFLMVDLTSSMSLEEFYRLSMSGPSASAPSSSPESCPLNFDVINWSKFNPGPSTPSGTCNQTCCAYIYTVLGLLLANTSHLAIPDYATAQVCLLGLDNEFQKRHLVTVNATRQCGLKAEDFTRPQPCNGTYTVSDLQSRVDARAMEANCFPAAIGSDCPSDCYSAMATAYLQLPNIDWGDEGCKFLFVNYVLSELNDWGSSIQVSSNTCTLTALLEFVGKGTSDRYPPSGIPSPGGFARNSTSISNSIPSLYEAGFAAGAAAIVVSILLAISMHVSRRVKRYTKEKELMEQQSSVMKRTVNENACIEWFSYDAIKISTSNFCPSNLIGQGGFGSVYKGTLKDGTLIAVKKFQNAPDVFGSSFVPELEVISRVRHKNLVVLRGCSIAYGMGDGHQLLLVYDYLPNGSLKDYIFDGKKPPLLWPERSKIAIGIATGLAYLHDESKPAIIHRDVKAANILLDGNLDALVADFGLAKFKPEDITHFTTRVAGTLGYVAPEYALYGQLTNKSDVYSFGILLLELMTGRRALNMFLTSETAERSLISHWAYDLFEKGKMNEIIDEKMCFQIWDKEEQDVMETFIKVGLLCAHSRITSRPTMAQALRMLNGEVQVGNVPDFPDAASVLQPISDYEQYAITLEEGTHSAISLNYWKAD